MSAVPARAHAISDADLWSKVERVCNRITASWPLDEFIAVNPHWGRIDLPIEHAAARIEVLGGMRLTPLRSDLRGQWQGNPISSDALRQAARELGCDATPEALTAALSQEPLIARLPILCEVTLRGKGPADPSSGLDMAQAQISQFCASYFDDVQAEWRMRGAQTMYEAWRLALERDASVRRALGRNRIAQFLCELPQSADELIPWACARLDGCHEHWDDYLEAMLLRLPGWASWCAFLRLRAGLCDEQDAHIEHYLAIWLAWECLLDDGHREADSRHGIWLREWTHAAAYYARAEQERIVDWVWLRALEIDYAAHLRTRLMSGITPRSTQLELQAVFCIDVRSEVIRRALEACDTRIQTIGYAGFFGLPMAFQPLGGDSKHSRMPGQLPTSVLGTQTMGDQAQDAVVAVLRRKNLQRQARTSRLLSLPGSAFGTVEAVGVLSGLSLLGHLTGFSGGVSSLEGQGLPAPLATKLKYQLTGVELETRVQLAAGALRGMGLTEQFAATVLIVGHTGQSANNPHAASLNCGACSGHSGQANARTLASLLNEPAVRAGLSAQGIPIPEATTFIPALHNTSTDEICMFDVPRTSPGERKRQEQIVAWLDAAGAATRRERAPLLDLDVNDKKPGDLLRALRKRATDWSQTRVEWGLANNAAMIIGPRDRTRGIDLEGRVFLHDYDWHQDAAGQTLAMLMGAPMIVAQWINFQYFASTVDPHHYGSGNKLLHNVIGGHIGVFEGNGGDLRIGLPLQSVHNGQRWMHEPLRMLVVIDAPAALIDSVLAANPQVRQLIENRWLWLLRFDDFLPEVIV
ncbi:DUF2309 domain-containing protein [Alcaligenaceae bacterium CGII-47]|nr:DUF2309 domain-containing protein [Alcaligenaceae bacterium CGII-47]